MAQIHYSSPQGQNYCRGWCDRSLDAAPIDIDLATETVTVNVGVSTTENYTYEIALTFEEIARLHARVWEALRKQVQSHQ